MIDIKQLVSGSRKLSDRDVSMMPDVRLLIMFADAFALRDLPVKHVGKIRIDVDESFFEHEDLPQQIVDNISDFLEKLRNHLVEEIGWEEVKTIMPDIIAPVGVIFRREKP